MIYSYILRRDYGFAPNPFYGICTLATCKKDIRKKASVSDWVIGCRSNQGQSNYNPYITYIMHISEKISFDEYWNDERFVLKKPIRNGSLKQWYGDNIYHYDKDRKFIQEPSHHSNEDGTPNYQNIIKDEPGKYVLIANSFWYWGENAISCPVEYIYLCHKGIGSTKKTDDPNFEKWINSIPQGYLGDPLEFKNGFKLYNGRD